MRLFRFFAVRLATIVAAVTIAVALLSLAVSWVLGSKAVSELAHRQFEEVTERQELAASAHLGAAIPAIETVADLMSGSLSKADDDALAVTFLSVLRANPGFTWVSHGAEDGRFVGAYRTPEGQLRINKSAVGADGKTETFEYDVDAKGGWKEIRHDTDARYDPRQRPWYAAAKSKGKRTWSAPYVFFASKSPGISCVRPRYDANGALLGVLSVDFDLQKLNAFAAESKPSPSTEVFIYTEDDTLLAHPTVGVITETELVKLPEVKVETLEAFLAARPPGGGDFDFTSSGRRFLASARRFPIDEGVTWTVAVIAPESDFVGGIQRRLGLSFAALGVILLLAVAIITPLVARRFAAPLRQMADELDRLGKLDLADRPLPTTNIWEIANMSRALGAMKGGLRSFSRYVPRDLVRRLLESGREATLGGEPRELTIFFSDIQGFTTMSETMPPSELVDILGDYLEEMTRIIGAHGGTVDKFLGDGILAFWGAPEADPDHALNGVRAAMACVKRLEERAASGGFNGHVLKTRIGIATGQVIVGNIGTRERLNYTVMGDTANLASRLEGVSKVYGTHLLVDERTATLVGDRIPMRPIDLVAVVGKEQPMRIFQPQPDTTPEALGRVKLSTEALTRYLAREFGAAAALWRSLKPEDEPARVLRSRAEQFEKAPPPPEWRGVYSATSK